MHMLAPRRGTAAWRLGWLAAWGVVVAWPVLADEHAGAPDAGPSAPIQCKPDEPSPGIVRIRWQRPGLFFPILGWRRPVDLAVSDLPVDHLMADLPPDSYNCHFYTKAYVEWRAGAPNLSRRLAAPRDDLVTEEYLLARGYRRVESSSARQGDLLLAVRAGDPSRRAVTHSAVVVEVDAGGAPRRIRQKFNPDCPVVDVDADEFRMLYAGQYPWRVETWRGPESQLALAAVAASR